MTFTLSIDMDNAAFDDDAGNELARILRAIADKAEAGQRDGSARDYNGNNVGKWKITGKRD